MVYATNLENGPGPKPDRPRHSHERASIKCNSNRVVKGSFYESSMTQYVDRSGLRLRRKIRCRGREIEPAVRGHCQTVHILVLAFTALLSDDHSSQGFGSAGLRTVTRHRHDNGRSRVAVGKSDEPEPPPRTVWENPLRHAGPGANFAFDLIRVCQYCFETCLRAL